MRPPPSFLAAGAALTFALLGLAATPVAAEPVGDAKNGAAIFKKCASCHAVGREAKNKRGPHLNGVFGRKAASLAGFKYSKAMARAGADGLVWHRDTLENFIESPKAIVSRTNMKFAGLSDPQDRKDLLRFLRPCSDKPANIPESDPTAIPTDPDVDPTILAIQGDPEYGEYLSSECVTCHREDGEDKGIPSITGWPKDDFVKAMHAYKTKARPHPVMRMMAGRLSDEEIAGLAAFFEGVGQEQKN